ncbi:DUF5683 domain-containing protein [Bacteroidales bacterium OttesenSCG-928-I21]|nr:DUF5683 domain-containing protein [Bacteroidales bacterium OttesenSCG-928-I21]
MNVVKKICTLIIFLFVSAFCCKAQTDTLIDTSKAHSPKKAAIYSAVLPSLGQIYNKKYWKLPIVYVGIGAFTYFAIDNQKEFNKYKKAYILRDEGKQDEFAGILNEQALLNEMDRWRKYRDLCIAGVAIIYALQIIDANVDAHLLNFDVGDNLSLKIIPTQFNAKYARSPIMGVGCMLKF